MLSRDVSLANTLSSSGYTYIVNENPKQYWAQNWSQRTRVFTKDSRDRCLHGQPYESVTSPCVPTHRNDSTQKLFLLDPDFKAFEGARHDSQHQRPLIGLRLGQTHAFSYPLAFVKSLNRTNMALVVDRPSLKLNWREYNILFASNSEFNVIRNGVSIILEKWLKLKLIGSYLDHIQ